ncbi:MAG: DUF899 family protein, partial [Verrucomicrobium sp.]
MSTNALAAPPTSTKAPKDDLSKHPVVARETWIKARKELMEKEKDLMKAQDALAAERRQLPWV